MMSPPSSQNNIVNQMTNMSLGDQQKPPSVVIRIKLNNCTNIKIILCYLIGILT